MVANAARYNTTDGWISVRTSTEDGTALLEVSNSGPRIDGDVQALLEPFRRNAPDRLSSSSQRGAGLGLSIVRAVAEAHGGSLTLHPRPEGGLTVSVRLPRGLA
ncbi:MAG: sensor histidine kinase [Actinomycetota bacterium]|nr:sensor histidine kinase [Actinomycetota bacterium]